ncbi:hypothetical protein [Staphylococcus agnetis]|uniref:hypothetical protein n=1 Tax=Staphylococcus agnetis TaxID=985762 RepID=UPI00208FA0FA|nr:hypothetical protein [Staphylococcus agnetis]MCO4349242.1 hypothetical protein [Staphylococcus agnetis]
MKMNISLFKVSVQEDILTSNDFTTHEKQAINSNHNNYNFIFEQLDLENFTIEELMDYFNFSGVKKNIFIINTYSKRLLKIIDFINKNINIDIFIYDNGSREFLQKNIDIDFYSIKFVFENKISISERLVNSYNAINSGIYDLKEFIHIKHIIVDNLDSINNLDETVIMNSGVNSLIIVENEPIKQENTFTFSKIILKKDFLSRLNKHNNFVKVDIIKESEKIDTFRETGLLYPKEGLPKNINKYFSSKKVHSLFIKDNAIYFDSDYQILLTKNISANIYEIINQLSTLNFKEYISDRFIRNYFIANAITNTYKKPLEFITPLNTGKIPAINEEEINSTYENFIGYKEDEDNFYIYNFIKNKTFKVPSELLTYYESIIKNRTSNLNQEKLTIVKELLKNVQ